MKEFRESKKQNDVSLAVGEKAVEFGSAAGRTTPPSAWWCGLVQPSAYDEDYMQSSQPNVITYKFK
jgi:hypothetical protein